MECEKLNSLGENLLHADAPRCCFYGYKITLQYTEPINADFNKEPSKLIRKLQLKFCFFSRSRIVGHAN